MLLPNERRCTAKKGKLVKDGVFVLFGVSPSEEGVQCASLLG